MASNQSGSSGSRKASREFNFTGFVLRLLASLVLVLATYNPSKYSFVAWLQTARDAGGLGPEHFVVGIILVIGWVVLLAATQRSLGTLGLILGGALLGGVVWLLADIGWLNIDSVSSATWIGLFCLAALLAIGLSWSHVWRRMTGQFEVDSDDG